MLGVVSVSPSWAAVGSTIDIFGQGFTGATSVSIGRTSAVFTVVDDGHIQAVVPDGAGGLFSTVRVVTPTGLADGGSFTPLYVGDWQIRQPRFITRGGLPGPFQGVDSPFGPLGARNTWNQLCDYTGPGPSDGKSFNQPVLRYLYYPGRTADEIIFVVSQAWLSIDTTALLRELPLDQLPVTPPNAFLVENEGMASNANVSNAFPDGFDVMPFIASVALDFTMRTDEGEWGPGGTYATFAPSTQTIGAWAINPFDVPGVDTTQPTFYGASVLTHSAGSVVANAADTTVEFTATLTALLLQQCVTGTGQMTMVLAYAGQRTHTPPNYNDNERALLPTLPQATVYYRQPRGRWYTYRPLPPEPPDLAAAGDAANAGFYGKRA